MGLSLDATINNFENNLSFVSSYPVVGTLAGGVKILMGTTQVISALAWAILTAIPALVTADYSPLNHSWTHFTHGLGNITAGTLEAIPLVQQLLYLFRTVMQMKTSDVEVTIRTEHENKFMPYRSLVEQGWTFGGADPMELEKVKKQFSTTLEELGGAKNISKSRKFEIAEEIIARKTTK